MAVPLNELHTLRSRGDAVVSSKNSLPEGNVVKTVWIGEGKIEFCDDFVARTPDAITKVRTELYAQAWKIVNRLRADGIEV